MHIAQRLILGLKNGKTNLITWTLEKLTAYLSQQSDWDPLSSAIIWLEEFIRIGFTPHSRPLVFSAILSFQWATTCPCGPDNKHAECQRYGRCPIDPEMCLLPANHRHREQGSDESSGQEYESDERQGLHGRAVFSSWLRQETIMFGYRDAETGFILGHRMVKLYDGTH